MGITEITLGDVLKNLREIEIMTGYSVFLSGFCFLETRWLISHFFGFCFRDLTIRVNSRISDVGLRGILKSIEFHLPYIHVGDGCSCQVLDAK